MARQFQVSAYLLPQAKGLAPATTDSWIRLRMTIRMIVQLPRVGGTLLARILGAQGTCLLFSEVHPGRKGKDLKNQAREYYGIRLPPWTSGYLPVLRAITRKAARPVLLRDHTHLNFTNNAGNSYRLENYDTVAKVFDTRLVALFRHPADQYLSCLSRVGMSKYMTIELFATAYVKFFIAAESFPRFRYEDLTNSPRHIVEQITVALALPFHPERVSRFATFHNVTGDGDQPSRGYQLSRISQLPRRSEVESLSCDLLAQPGMKEVCQELGYRF